MLWDGSMAINVAATGQRLGLGFCVGVAAATLAGMASGMSARIRDLIDPTLQGLRSVPSLAWVPLFMIWFGIFDLSKIILIAVGVFFPVYLNLASSLAGVDRKLVEVGRIYGFSRWQSVLRIEMPASLPSYLVGLRSGLGLGWMFVASAEMMGASEGLGYILINGEQVGRPDEVIVAIIVFALLGKATDLILFHSIRHFGEWQDNVKS